MHRESEGVLVAAADFSNELIFQGRDASRVVDLLRACFLSQVSTSILAELALGV